MAIQFRCPHRPWKVPADKSRDSKAAERRNLYVVPADAEWTRVDDEYSPGKEGHPRYAHEVGARWETEVKCPDCGDTIKVATDQDPEKPTTFDAAIEKQRRDAEIEAQRQAAEAAARQSEA